MIQNPVQDTWHSLRFLNFYNQGNAQRPEVRVVTWNNDELATDALPVHGYEHYKAKDYSLAHAPFSGKFYLPYTLQTSFLAPYFCMLYVFMKFVVELR